MVRAETTHRRLGVHSCHSLTTHQPNGTSARSARLRETGHHSRVWMKCRAVRRITRHCRSALMTATLDEPVSVRSGQIVQAMIRLHNHQRSLEVINGPVIARVLDPQTDRPAGGLFRPVTAAGFGCKEHYSSVPRTLKGAAVGGFSDAVLCRR